MYPISPMFEEFLRSRGRTWEAAIEVNGVSYGKDKIVEFNIENSLAPGSDFTIGSAVASTMSMTLRINEDLPIGAKVVPYISLSAADVTWIQAEFSWADADFTWLGDGLEGMPLGEFYIDTRRQVKDTYVYSCLDKLVLGNSAYISQLDYPVSMEDVWNEICAELELENADTVTLEPYILNAAPSGYTMREVLGYIAAVNCASVFVGKDGKINLRKYRANDNAVFEIETDDYFSFKQTNPLRTFTKVEVTYDVEDKLTYTAGEGDENATISITNPLATQDIVNDMLAKINGFSFLPVEMDVRGYPQVEVGDRITVAKQEGKSWAETITAWDETHISWEGKTYHQTIITLLKYSFKGGLGMSIKSVSKSTQQSEFNSPKVLEQQVNRQTANALRYDKPYYGVTHSRTRGIVVNREDGAAEAIFNADELKFRAGGEDALWFDVPSKKFHFSGTLIGVDGEFSGTVSAATIIGSKVHGGTIEGTTIRGSEFFGGTFSTRETGYPRIIMTDTADLLAAEYSDTQKIVIDPNGYMGNPYPFLRFINGAYEGSIRHAGASGWIFNSERVVMQADLEMGAGGKLWAPDLTYYTFGVERNLYEELEDRVPYWVYNPKIADIEARLTALENQIQ